MKPNVIMILIDDLGWWDLSCQGSSFYETPHIDQLRKEGMAFDQAYARLPRSVRPAAPVFCPANIRPA